MAATTRYDVSRDELAELLGGAPSYRVEQVWSGLYEQVADPDDWTNVPKAMRADLAERLPSALTPVTESVSDRGDTVKFLWELDGGSRVETVLMLYRDRATVCVSSQAGCAMACGFCATGQAGFTRHLTVGEIVEFRQLILLLQDPSERLSQVFAFDADGDRCNLTNDTLLDTEARPEGMYSEEVGGAVFTRDLDTALRVFRRIDASAVMVNDHTAFRVDGMP